MICLMLHHHKYVYGTASNSEDRGEEGYYVVGYAAWHLQPNIVQHRTIHPSDETSLLNSCKNVLVSSNTNHRIWIGVA
jgi:hypothetical protein